MEEARAEGRLVQAIPLDQIDPGHLVRDRIEAEEEELRTLMESLRARGQQTPIELVDRGESAAPRYGLISGWRRLAALKRLAEEEDRFGTVLALIRAPKTASDAYVAMVEENEIRVGLSYYERARIVVKSVEQGVFDDRRTALRTLFANVSRAKRSKIGSFTRIVEALDGALRFPSAIGERTGLDLARRLDEDPELAGRLKGELRKPPAPDAEAELARLEAPAEMDAALARIQNDLFDLGADMCTPDMHKDAEREYPPLRMAPEQVTRLESEIDAMNAKLEPLRSFILPGGSALAAQLHVCRTVARRAERLAVELATVESVNPDAVKYLNRLSDWFFVAARIANNDGKDDVLWVPGANR